MEVEPCRRCEERLANRLDGNGDGDSDGNDDGDRVWLEPRWIVEAVETF